MTPPVLGLIPGSTRVPFQVTAHANGDLSFFVQFHIYCLEFKQVRGASMWGGNAVVGCAVARRVEARSCSFASRSDAPSWLP